MLPQSFVDEDFDFFGRTLSGQPENKERWKRGRLRRRVVRRRGRRPALRRAVVPAGGQGAHAGARRQPRRGLPAVLLVARVDGHRHPRAGRSPSSTRSRPRSATPTCGATTPRSRSTRPTSSATSRRSTAFEVDRNLAKIGRPDRPQRVVHAAADGQRLLHAVDERDRLPGGDPPAAVLRPRGRRRRQLRRHRRGHRPRARSRLRRPGLALRRHRGPARLVDRGRPRAVRRAVAAAHRAVQRATRRRGCPTTTRSTAG